MNGWGMNEEALYLEPRQQFDAAILGISYGTGVLVYDAYMVVDSLVDVNKLTYEEAMEHFEFNIAGAMGENYPIYLWSKEVDEI